MEAPFQHYDAFKLRVDVFRKMNFDWKHPSSMQKILQEYSTAIEPDCQWKSTMATVEDLKDFKTAKNVQKSGIFTIKCVGERTVAASFPLLKCNNHKNRCCNFAIDMVESG